MAGFFCEAGKREQKKKGRKALTGVVIGELVFAEHGLIAGIAQLVEHDLAKVGVASSSLVSRSIFLLFSLVSFNNVEDVNLRDAVNTSM